MGAETCPESKSILCCGERGGEDVATTADFCAGLGREGVEHGDLEHGKSKPLAIAETLAQTPGARKKNSAFQK
jgi:hypothetical protein